MQEKLESIRIFIIYQNFEIQRYYRKELRFNGAKLRNSLPKIKHGAYVTNLYEYKSVGANHWIALYVNVDNVIYFDSFGADYVPK